MEDDTEACRCSPVTRIDFCRFVKPDYWTRELNLTKNWRIVEAILLSPLMGSSGFEGLRAEQFVPRSGTWSGGKEGTMLEGEPGLCSASEGENGGRDSSLVLAVRAKERRTTEAGFIGDHDSAE